MNIFIHPYKLGSASVKELKQALPAKVIKLGNSNFKGKKDRLVVNWGCSDIPNPEVHACRKILNHPVNVGNVSNKRTFFTEIHDTKLVPEFTTDIKVAQSWTDKGMDVVCRHVLTGHSGNGIELCDEGDIVPNAPLYVKYIKKTTEFRCHVFPQTGMAFTQQKGRRHDVPDGEVNWKIRNHKNGFIYMLPDSPPELLDRISKMSLATVDHFKLDFGAVDIIYNKRNDRLYILEINSAPGLVGRTVDFYKDQFNKIKEMQG